MTTGCGYFTSNFTGNNLDYDGLKRYISPAGVAYTSHQDSKDVARQIREYCKGNKIEFKNKKTSDNTYSADGSGSNSRSANITINENKGLGFWDYFLLSHIFNSRQQPIIINNAPGAAAYSTSSTQKEKSKDKTNENQINKFLFLMALCVIAHLMVCAAYHLYFKKEAEKPNTPIDYLANRQRDISIFQLALGAVSFAAASMFLSQSSVFFPFLVNTFICLGSSFLFYREHNETMEKEVTPCLELAELIIKERDLPSAPLSPPGKY